MRKLNKNVPMTIIYSDNVQTINKIIYKDDFEPDSDLANVEFEYGDGDQTVNIESLQYFTKYANQNDKIVHEHIIDKEDHLSILKSRAFIDLIQKLLGIEEVKGSDQVTFNILK